MLSLFFGASHRPLGLPARPCEKHRWCHTHAVGIPESTDLSHTHSPRAGEREWLGHASQIGPWLVLGEWVQADGKGPVSAECPALSTVTTGLLQGTLDCPCASHPLPLTARVVCISDQRPLLPSFFPDECGAADTRGDWCLQPGLTRGGVHWTRSPSLTPCSGRRVET